MIQPTKDRPKRPSSIRKSCAVRHNAVGPGIAVPAMAAQPTWRNALGSDWCSHYCHIFKHTDLAYDIHTHTYKRWYYKVLFTLFWPEQENESVFFTTNLWLSLLLLLLLLFSMFFGDVLHTRKCTWKWNIAKVVLLDSKERVCVWDRRVLVQFSLHSLSIFVLTDTTDESH